LHLLQRSAPRTRVSSHALLHLVSNWSAAQNVIAASAPPPLPRPARSVYTDAATRKKEKRQKGSLLPRPGSAAFVDPRVLLETMGSSAGTHERYAGPVPTCPRTLDDPAPELTREMLRVPTSELYSAALEAAWQELDGDTEGQRPTPDRVAQLEPNSKEYSSPRPRHYGPYAVERASLDWSYHVVPNRARQALQDEIVSLVLEKRLRDCRDAGDDEPCRVFEAREGFREGETVSRVDEEDMGRKGEGRPGDKGRPLALFTAGCALPTSLLPVTGNSHPPHAAEWAPEKVTLSAPCSEATRSDYQTTPSGALSHPASPVWRPARVPGPDSRCPQDRPGRALAPLARTTSISQVGRRDCVGLVAPGSVPAARDHCGRRPATEEESRRRWQPDRLSVVRRVHEVGSACVLLNQENRTLTLCCHPLRVRRRYHQAGYDCEILFVVSSSSLIRFTLRLLTKC
jgi:hypothetical protein